jgi:murein DD-endopeptidase MepM/ murein hydrolase activator NlpD
LPKIKAVSGKFPIRKGAFLVFIALTSVDASRFQNVPDFADYRDLGRVLQPYSRNQEANAYGVTLRLSGRVTSLAEGRVVSLGRLRGYGRYVIVDHGQGWHSLYSNLGEVRVSQGREIRRGAVIGSARHKRLFLVVSYRGNPINPSDVMGTRSASSLS